LAGAHQALELVDRQLGEHPFLAADRYTIADIAVFAYAHVAEEAGIDTAPYGRFRDWLGRVAAQPGFIDDLEPYPPNASVLAGRSIYG
jgi:glutathione S-transferase